MSKFDNGIVLVLDPRNALNLIMVPSFILSHVKHLLEDIVNLIKIMNRFSFSQALAK